MKNKKILITGGSGNVGKHLKEILPDATYISTKDGDLKDIQYIEWLISSHTPEVVIHLAAKVGGIKDNIENPLTYFEDNILINTNVLKTSYKYKVKQFIGILSTCAYPDEVNRYPMDESDLHKGPPPLSNFGYGYAKRCLAVQIEAYNKQHKTNYQYIIPSNLYSEYCEKSSQSSHFINSLINKIIEGEMLGMNKIDIWGDGKSLRQFTYAGDLANIIKYVVNNNIKDSFNFAYPQNYSINDITLLALDVLNHKDWEINYSNPHLNGQFRKDVSIEKLKTISPHFKFTSLEEGIKKIYKILKSKN